MEVDLLSFLFQDLTPKSQAEHFSAHHLQELFRSKIAKSQATGRDGMRIGRFQDVLSAETSLIESRVSGRSYKFTTYKERLILRGPAREPRQISIPTVRDRLTLRALCQVLHTYAPHSRGEAPHTLVKRVVSAIRDGDQSKKAFVRIDVRNFFPSISHPILMRELTHVKLDENIVSLCEQAVSTPTGSTVEPNTKGVPQGLSISGALSALYMQRFDRRRLNEYPHYFRYVDDILIICDASKPDDVLKSVGRALKSRGLTIHEKGVAGKTEISAVTDGIDFLGYNICIDRVSIRKSSYKKMFNNLLRVITDYRYRNNIDRLKFRLNLKITGCIVDSRRRGWLMFFSYTEDKTQLSHLDAFLRSQLIRVGFPKDQLPSIKTFIKSYHEIRYNLSQTNYIPNLNNFDPNEKIAAIAALSTRWTKEEVSTWAIEVIEEEFSRLISREIQDLEQDIGSPS